MGTADGCLLNPSRVSHCLPGTHTPFQEMHSQLLLNYQDDQTRTLTLSSLQLLVTAKQSRVTLLHPTLAIAKHRGIKNPPAADC